MFTLNPFAQLKEENVVLPNALIMTNEERKYIISQSEIEDIHQILLDDQEEDGTVCISNVNEDVPDEGSPQKIKKFEDKDSDEIISTTSVHEPQNIKPNIDFPQNSEIITQLYSKISSLKVDSLVTEDHSYKLMLLEYTDKLLQIKGSSMKANMRGPGKHFSNIFINQPKTDHLITLHLYQSEILTILATLNWNILNQVNSSD